MPDWQGCWFLAAWRGFPHEPAVCGTPSTAAISAPFRPSQLPAVVPIPSGPTRTTTMTSDERALHPARANNTARSLPPSRPCRPLPRAGRWPPRASMAPAPLRRDRLSRSLSVGGVAHPDPSPQRRRASAQTAITCRLRGRGLPAFRHSGVVDTRRDAAKAAATCMLVAKGAMGLMQIMPQTWSGLRPRYGLGGDPYDPRDNISPGRPICGSCKSLRRAGFSCRLQCRSSTL